MELTFLGTGAGVPSKERNVSAVALRFTDAGGETWLFDCGEATQHQVLSSPVKLTRVTRIWITHLHGDHIFGLPGLLGSRSFQGAETPLILYGPAGLKEYVEVSLKTSGTYLRYPLTVEEVTDGRVLEEHNGVRVRVQALDHTLPCYGYRVEEPDRPGRLQVERLKREGVAPGPHFRDLKAGKEVILPDGRRLYGSDYLEPNKPGRQVVILGDTRAVPEITDFARGADVLVHEATFGEGEEEMATRHGHSTTVQAAEMAKRAGVKRLILTHISARYRLANEKELLAQARRVFPHTELARDHEVVVVSSP
ncbi:ribonuclease Z [Marinithermofilum abyssi]|uniref:Ribonuclease Z n=1 Tax=Marinithermofilum abyssi TaxID=1571185 RepID=A0A8J2VGR1_9BACL|nr:ribonuclease Z [Marinithermofilum abyssi]GGE03350.1 ribonuclease Z [Marinithermofilum abyssi]